MVILYIFSSCQWSIQLKLGGT